MKLRKCLSKIIAFSIGICTIVSSSAVHADSSINLTAEANNEGNYVSLKWNAPDDSGRYSYMIYSKESNESEFQSIPAKCNVKVLNIYPNVGNNLKGWMENPNSESPNGYGKGLISVDEVSISNFNANPAAYLKDSSGNWKYDVIYQGAWDANNGVKLNSTAINLVEEYINSGRGFLAGHDTIGYTWGDSGLSHLRNYFNIKVGKWSSSYADTGYDYDTVGFRSTNVKIKRKGLLTNYPWSIGDIGTTLTIPLAHSTSNFALGDIWMTFPENTYYNSQTSSLSPELKQQLNFYLTTWNNTAMIQTGHSNGAATPDEQKVLANTIFYLSQTTEATEWDDHKGQDLTAPTMPSINSVSYDALNKSINVNYMSSTDKGSTYDYYIEATNVDTKEKVQSETKSATVTSGLKGYSIVVDNKADTIPSGDITTTDTTTTVSLNGVEAKDIYVHVAAVDNAGNISEVSHYKYGYPLLTLTPSTTEITNSQVTITAKATSDTSKIIKVQTPDGRWIDGDTAQYNARANGTYTFAAVDENGVTVTQSITISNIDDTKVILNIEPEKDKIYLESEVEADLTIDNIQEIAAEDVRIKYDNSKLEFLGMEEVPGIKIVKDENGEGELRVILASQGKGNIVLAKKTLLKLHFKGIAEGEALVDITKGRVSDGITMERDLLDNQCGQATITIEAYKDPNKDGEFTLLDLAIDGRHYGENPEDLPQYKTDVVENGAIDDEDLLKIGQYMLENPNYKF